MDIDWAACFRVHDISNNVDLLYDTCNKLIDSHVPLKSIQPSTYPDWFSKELISKIILKKKFHEIWLQYGNLINYIEFRRLRALCIRLSLSSRSEYIKNVENSCRQNSKFFWNFVNKLSNSNYMPGEMYLNGDKVCTTNEICELFAKRFNSVYENSSSPFLFEIHTPPVINHFVITTEEVTRAINGLKNKTSIGPDGLPARFLKKCVSSLSEPLCLLFNQSLVNR